VLHQEFNGHTVWRRPHDAKAHSLKRTKQRRSQGARSTRAPVQDINAKT
jgi:hypothetical protein